MAQFPTGTGTTGRLALSIPLFAGVQKNKCRNTGFPRGKALEELMQAWSRVHLVAATTSHSHISLIACSYFTTAQPPLVQYSTQKGSEVN